jgi:hypothetical protein
MWRWHVCGRKLWLAFVGPGVQELRDPYTPMLGASVALTVCPGCSQPLTPDTVLNDPPTAVAFDGGTP